MIKIALAGAVMAVAASSASAGTFAVSFEAQKPGVATAETSATFKTNSDKVAIHGVETFDELSTGSYNTATFDGGSPIHATYSGGVQIDSANKWGGAGNKGNYIAANSNQPYALTIATPGVNYFGFWLSALDKGNSVTFFGESGQKLFTFDPQDVFNAIKSLPQAEQKAYYGNPFAGGADSSEPFVYLNFFDQGGAFSRIEFAQTWSGGEYESDNHALGIYDTMGTGIKVPLVLSGVPEPSTWATMLLGFVSLAFAGYRGRRPRCRLPGRKQPLRPSDRPA